MENFPCRTVRLGGLSSFNFSWCQILKPRQAEQIAEKAPKHFVIPSEAKNLSFFSRPQTQERFFASLGMTKLITFSALTTFSAPCEACPTHGATR
jgi:hypothetical protein